MGFGQFFQGFWLFISKTWQVYYKGYFLVLIKLLLTIIIQMHSFCILARGRSLTMLTRRGRQVVLKMPTVYSKIISSPKSTRGRKVVNNGQNSINVVKERSLRKRKIIANLVTVTRWIRFVWIFNNRQFRYPFNPNFTKIAI